MKYKIYNFLLDTFYPKTECVFLPNPNLFLDSLEVLEWSTLEIYIYVYEDFAIHSKEAINFFLLEDFELQKFKPFGEYLL